ncbi:MAG TPA: LamG domain-containing protein [Thermoanaerobaculia bacterium]|jgi:hypothetical protein|nr:LamG domain-containing protein [Thermoanaerobaculia bacterium]
MRSIFVTLAVFITVSAASAQVCVPAPYGIVSWYPAETNAQDVVSSNNGSVNGSVTFGPGKVRQAFQFHGQPNDGINLGNVAAFDFSSTSSFSIEAWVNVTSYANTGSNDGFMIVTLNYTCTAQTPAAEVLAIQLPSRGAIFMVRDANSQQVNLLSSMKIPAGVWTHLVAVRDASCSPKKVYLYVNGVLSSSANDPTGASGASLANTGPDYIGRRMTCGTNNPFNGGIDEVSIYSRALTECEIKALYNAGCAGKCRPGTCPAAGCGC